MRAFLKNTTGNEVTESGRSSVFGAVCASFARRINDEQKGIIIFHDSFCSFLAKMYKRTKEKSLFFKIHLVRARFPCQILRQKNES